ncbi:MAG: SAM-dependent methyltransferase, partial [Pseudomonadales bacterium]|nr:SAM-dependent methyltransferase [Pseudomonadales bacterium]
YDYFPDPAGMRFPGGQPSYAGEEFIASECHEWAHSIGEVITSLLDAGLTITAFAEHPVTMYRQFPGMVEGDDGFWRLPFDEPRLPLMFTLTATK